MNTNWHDLPTKLQYKKNQMRLSLQCRDSNYIIIIINTFLCILISFYIKFFINLFLPCGSNYNTINSIASGCRKRWLIALHRPGPFPSHAIRSTIRCPRRDWRQAGGWSLKSKNSAPVVGPTTKATCYVGGLRVCVLTTFYHSGWNRARRAPTVIQPKKIIKKAVGWS